MRILGIDPALTTLGWGIIEARSPRIGFISSGLIKTKTDKELYQRLSHITTGIRSVINQYQPEAVAMEITFLNNNAASSLKLAYVRGAIMTIIGELQLPYYEYSPNQIKKTLVGLGHAQKEQIKYMLKVILAGFNNSISLDEADALAAAYTCFTNMK
ncbi:MAG: crossover junction endodeoxyribonuclease RuvC [Rickettsiaceae bacterium]|nr:crossover junction endodeoxyribonuclease RuvC [Rickettsiaceae bacterium]